MIFKISNCFCYRLIVDYNIPSHEQKTRTEADRFHIFKRVFFKFQFGLLLNFSTELTRKTYEPPGKAIVTLETRQFIESSMPLPSKNVSAIYPKISIKLYTIYLTKSSHSYQTTRSQTPLIVNALEMLY